MTALPDERIEIRLVGSWCNRCVPHVWRWTVSGNGIRVDLTHVVGICLPVGTPWEDTTTVGPLPHGCYRILAAPYGVGNPMDPPFLQEEPTELAILCRPASTRIASATDDPFFSLSWQATGNGGRSSRRRGRIRRPPRHGRFRGAGSTGCARNRTRGGASEWPMVGSGFLSEAGRSRVRRTAPATGGSTETCASKPGAWRRRIRVDPPW